MSSAFSLFGTYSIFGRGHRGIGYRFIVKRDGNIDYLRWYAHRPSPSEILSGFINGKN